MPLKADYSRNKQGRRLFLNKWFLKMANFTVNFSLFFVALISPFLFVSQWRIHFPKRKGKKGSLKRHITSLSKALLLGKIRTAGAGVMTATARGRSKQLTSINSILITVRWLSSPSRWGNRLGYLPVITCRRNEDKGRVRTQGLWNQHLCHWPPCCTVLYKHAKPTF